MLSEEEFGQACKRRYELNYMCKLALQAKQWQDLLFALKKMVAMMRKEFKGADLTAVEKNYFYTAFKSLVQIKRKQWRTLYEQYNKEEEIDPSEDTNFKLKLI